MTIDLHGWRGVAAAGVSGALLAASLPPQGVPAIVFVALVPLLAVLRARTSWREGLRLGYVAGVVMMAIGYPWFVGLFQVFGDLPLVVALAIFAVYCSWSAVPIAVWAALMVALPLVALAAQLLHQHGLRAQADADLSTLIELYTE